MKEGLRAFVPTVIAARIESGVADLFVYENRKLVSVFMKARRISRDLSRDVSRDIFRDLPRPLTRSHARSPAISQVLGLGGEKLCEVHDIATCHAAVGAVQEKIRKFMGSITRLITDDKGTRFLIAFGMPGQARPPPPLRAPRASERARADTTLARAHALTARPF